MGYCEVDPLKIRMIPKIIFREVRQNSDAYKVGIRIGDAIERVVG